MNEAASLVDKSLDGTWVSLVVVFAPNLKLHHLLYVEKPKIHKVIFPFGSDVCFMLLDDLLSINLFCQLMQCCHIIKLGGKWKTRVSAAAPSFPYLPLCVLAISSFALKYKPAQANIA